MCEGVGTHPAWYFNGDLEEIQPCIRVRNTPWYTCKTKQQRWVRILWSWTIKKLDSNSDKLQWNCLVVDNFSIKEAPAWNQCGIHCWILTRSSSWDNQSSQGTSDSCERNDINRFASQIWCNQNERGWWSAIGQQLIQQIGEVTYGFGQHTHGNNKENTSHENHALSLF